MGLDDKISNKTEELGGRAKEAAGAATNDESLRAEGRTDQKKASVKEKVEDVKDKVKDKIDDL